MDNTNERYTDKELANFVEWWNEGVPIEEIAKRMRRSKGAIYLLSSKLRGRGYRLVDKLDRMEATRNYKARQERQAGIDALERSLQAEADTSGEDIPANDAVIEDLDPQVEQFIELWNNGTSIQDISAFLGEPAAALLLLPHKLRKEGHELIPAAQRAAMTKDDDAQQADLDSQPTPERLPASSDGFEITTIVRRSGVEVFRSTQYMRDGV